MHFIFEGISIKLLGFIRIFKLKNGEKKGKKKWCYSYNTLLKTQGRVRRNDEWRGFGRYTVVFIIYHRTLLSRFLHPVLLLSVQKNKIKMHRQLCDNLCSTDSLLQRITGIKETVWRNDSKAPGVGSSRVAAELRPESREASFRCLGRLRCWDHCSRVRACRGDLPRHEPHGALLPPEQPSSHGRPGEGCASWNEPRWPASMQCCSASTQSHLQVSHHTILWVVFIFDVVRRFSVC